jgi:hypothetical protein
MTHEQKREAIVRAYIVHDPEDGDYLSWSHTADMGHGHTPLYKLETLPREPGESELREALEQWDHFQPYITTPQIVTLANEMAEAIRGAISRHAQDAEGWRPIETAPKDGTVVLLYRPLAERTLDPVMTIRKTTANPRHCWPATIPEGADGLNFTEGSCFATHWMPIPAAPRTEKGK